MLQQFLRDNREELIQRCRDKAARRSAPGPAAIPLEHGIPIFLEQLIGALPSAGPAERAALAPITPSAARHGAELQRNDFTIAQVVHDYGDLCQAITELAIERGATIDVAEFQVLNQSLDDAIADAVTEYASASSAMLAERDLRAEAGRLGELVHELRNLVHTATLAIAAIKAGNVGLSGATGAVLDRSMTGLRTLIDRTLAQVRARSQLAARSDEFPLDHFIRDAAMGAALEASNAGCRLDVDAVDARLAVRGDRDLLMAALANLLQNAFKFSHKGGEVSLRAYASGQRILIEVADSCGGLPSGTADELFSPFVQAGKDRSGLGLGLAIVKRSVEANQGMVSVRDAAPVGCVFSIDLPVA